MNFKNDFKNIFYKHQEWECQVAKIKNKKAGKGITTGVKLEIKEKRQKKGEEEGCME
jgi:hypothetical protein